MKWEQKPVLLTGNLHDVARTLAELGEQGWELVCMSGAVGYFKRPKPNPAPKAAENLSGKRR